MFAGMRLVHLGFKEQQRSRCCWGKHTRGEWDVTEAEIGQAGPVSLWTLQRPRLLLQVSWEARESCGQRTDMNRYVILKYHTVENKLWQQEEEF